MVRALHRQKVAVRAPARTAFVRELRKRNAAGPRPRRPAAGRPAGGALVPRPAAPPPAAPAAAGEPTAGEPARRRARGALRPVGIAALAVVAAVVPASLVIAAAWPSEPLTLAGAGHADAVLYRAVIAADGDPAASAAAVPPPARSLQVRSYRVAADDSLSAIAHRFDIDLDTLISFNGIRDAADLQEGVDLAIPNASGLHYAVRPGDTLSDLAARHGVPLAALLDWNDLRSSALDVGRKLFIPGAPLPDQERNAVLGRLFLMPAAGAVTTPFGHHPDPVTGIGRFHDGIDIAHAPGTPVTAAMSGRVGRVGVNGTYGRYVVLVHADGYQTLYARLGRVHATTGSFVAQSRIVGTMGSTGMGAAAGHLHFSIFKAGEPVDPMRYLH